MIKNHCNKGSPPSVTNRVLLSVGVIIFSTTALAAPFIPESGDTVIATWPVEDTRLIQKKITEDDAIKQSIDLLARAKQPGQSHLYSQAQTLLAPWVQNNSDNSLLWLTWARVQQHKHIFNDAKIALEKSLKLEPSNVNAYLLLARIHTIEQDYTLATTACKKVYRYGDIATGSVCSLSAASYQGKLEQSYTTLKKLLEHQSFDDDRRVWANLILADMAARQELWPISEYWLDKSLDNNDVSSLVEWSDIKLQLGKAEPVMRKLSALATSTVTIEDAILLRLALAEKQLNKDTESQNSVTKGSATLWKDRITKRIALREQRQDLYHASDITIYYLDIEPDAQKALHWASLNWQQAQENKDRVLLERAQRASSNKVSS